MQSSCVAQRVKQTEARTKQQLLNIYVAVDVDIHVRTLKNLQLSKCRYKPLTMYMLFGRAQVAQWWHMKSMATNHLTKRSISHKICVCVCVCVWRTYLCICAKFITVKFKAKLCRVFIYINFFLIFHLYLLFYFSL